MRRRLLDSTERRKASGNPILVKSVARRDNGLNVYGKSEQFSTTGAQLIPFVLDEEMVSRDGHTKATPNINGIECTAEYGANIAAKSDIYFVGGESVYQEYPVLVSGEYELRNSSSLFNAYVVKEGGTILANSLNGSAVNFTVSGTEKYRIFLRPYKNVAESETSKDVVQVILRKKGATTNWEIYTGGKPSPSPEYPQEIVSVGDNGQIGVDVYGGNLLDVYNLSYVDNCILQFDGSFKSNIVNEYFCEIRISNVQWLKNGDTLHFRINDGIPDKRMTIVVYGEFENGSTMFEVSNLSGENEVSLTLQGMISVLHIVLRFNRSGIAFSDTETIISGLMFSVFDADSYEPYKQPQTITFNTPGGLPGIPVNSNGNYTDENGQQWVCDSIEYHRGKLSYVQRVKWIEFDGSADELWDVYSAYNGFLLVVRDAKIGTRLKGFCNKFDIILHNESNILSRTGIWLGVSNNYFYIINVSEYATTLEEWRAWLQSNPVKFLYQLETPIVTPIEDTELIEQLKEMHTNRPTTTVLSSEDCGIQLEYKTKKYLEVD